MSEVKKFFDGAADRVNQDAIQAMNSVFQFTVTGEGGGEWNVSIARGQAHTGLGKAPMADVAITVSAEDFVALLHGTLNAQTAFLMGRIKLEGDLGLAMRLKEIFSFA